MNVRAESQERSEDFRAPSTSAQERIASFGSYGEAREAVDLLADRDFPVERLSIVGHRLNFVEEVTGRRGYGKAALSAAASGAAIGATFGFVAGFFNWVDPLVSALALALYGLVLGAIIGAVFGVLMHGIDGVEFSSVESLRADHYDVVADLEIAADAREAWRTAAAAPRPAG